MTSYVIVQRRADEAQVANLRLALVKKLHFAKICVPFVRMVATYWPWVADEGIQSRRRRNLLEDNPTSG
jgi:hypothetical protein